MSAHPEGQTRTTPAGAATALSDADYQRHAGGLLAHIEATVDAWLDADTIDIDSQRTGGLLELHFPGGSKIIINLQPPLHEVWLAAKGGGVSLPLAPRTGRAWRAVAGHPRQQRFFGRAVSPRQRAGGAALELRSARWRLKTLKALAPAPAWHQAKRKPCRAPGFSA